MIGIAVANAVLLIEFILHQAEHHGGITDHSIMAGSKARLRPILMTSLASILGLVPMAIGLGHGSEANIPLGRAVIGGQLLSVTLTLFVVPILVKLFLEKKNGSTAPTILAGIFVLMFASTQTSIAAEPNPGEVLSVAQVVKLTLANSPALKGAELNSKAAEQEIGVKQAGYFPKLEFDAIDSTGFPGATGLMGVGGLMGSPYRSGASAGFVATANLYDFGRTSGRVAEAKSELALTKVGESLTEQNIKEEALNHLIACTYWASLEGNIGSLVEESKMVENEVKRYVRTGQRSSVESYLVESQTEEIRTELADSGSRKKDELKALGILMAKGGGYDCPTFDTLNLTQVSEVSVADARLENIPLIEQGDANLKVAEIRLGIAKADFYPELVGIASIGALENARLVNKQDYSLGIGLRFPLFEGLKTMHEVHKAQAEVDARSAFLDSVKEQFVLANQSFDQKIRSAQIRLDHLKAEHELADKSLRLAKQRYSSFQGSLIDLRESLRNQLRVLNQENEAKRDFFLAEMQKAVYLGGI